MSEPSLTGQAFKNGIMSVFLVVPTIVSIMVSFQLKTLEKNINIVDKTAPQIICFTAELCAIKVQDKWYRINGIIDLDAVTPDEYKEVIPDPPESSKFGIRNNKTKE